MDGHALFREVIAEAAKLGLAWWERLALILATALFLVMGRRAWSVLRNLTPPEPFPGMDASPPMDMPEGGIPIPPKEWKDGEP